MDVTGSYVTILGGEKKKLLVEIGDWNVGALVKRIDIDLCKSHVACLSNIRDGVWCSFWFSFEWYESRCMDVTGSYVINWSLPTKKNNKVKILFSFLLWFKRSKQSLIRGSILTLYIHPMQFFALVSMIYNWCCGGNKREREGERERKGERERDESSGKIIKCTFF